MQENKMGTKPVLPLLISMAIPAMFSMIVLSLYNIVDSLYVSKYAQEGVTALSIAFPIQMLLTAVGVGTAVGINSLMARRLGEKKDKEAANVALHGIILAVIAWVLFALFGLFGVTPFVNMFTSNAVVADYSVSYLSIILVASLGCLIQATIEKELQSTGAMTSAMVVQLVGAITNIILDPIMIFGYLGCPSMGVAGAAIATVVGQFLGAGVGLYFLFFRVKTIHVTFKGFHMSSRIINDIYSVGFPSILMQAIGSVTTMTLNLILAGFSDAAVTALGLYFKLQSFIFMPVFGMNQGLMPIMGYNFGARNKKRIYEAVKYGVIIAVVIMCIGTALFNLIPEVLLGIFSAEGELLTLGSTALRIIGLSFPMAAVSIIASTVFQAIGKGKYSLYISLLRQIILIIPIAFVLSKIMGVNGVWVAYPLAEIIAVIISSVMYFHAKKTIIEKLDEEI